ncbi:MAG: choice-of-anchor I family protein [Candidatus Nanopelagicaceae bacterium]
MKKLSLAVTTLFTTSALITAGQFPVRANEATVKITEISAISLDGEGSGEIATFHPGSKRIFATNGVKNAIDIFDISNVAAPKKVGSLSLSPYGNDVTSVAAGRDVVVAAVLVTETFSATGAPSTPNGKLVVFDTNGKVLSSPDILGVLPDSVTFAPNGTTALVAIEGQPVCAKDDPATTAKEDTDYSKASDPEGGVSIVDLTNPAAPVVKFAGFKQFNVAQMKAKGIAVSSVVNNVAKDFEPEFITAVDNKYAYVTIQEANAIGKLDIEAASFESVTRAFESKLSVTARDTSDRDSGAGPRNYANVVGASQPDAIASFKVGSGHYFVTANEGDAREYTCLNDDQRGSSLKVDTRRFPNWSTLSASAALGRAKVNPTIGDRDGDGDIDTIHLRGSNSMTMYRNGIALWDSGELLDQIQIKAFGVANINGSHSLSSDKSTMNYVGQDRSDDKGSEPEGVAVGMVGNTRVAILGLERMTALAVFDITQPRSPVFQEWLQMLPAKATPAKDVKHWSPEGIVFVPADKSPSGKALIITSYELSGSISIHQIEPRS